MLEAILSGDLIRIIYTLFSVCILLLVCTPAHECAHALAAKLLGDDTGEKMGRLTLNPLAHFDPIGTVGIALFGIGWAKPVPVSTMRCTKVKSRKAAMAITAAAGPVSNILMALIFMIIMKTVMVVTGLETSVAMYVCFALEYIVEINIALGLFNLVPVPPLDGSRIALAFLPQKYYFGLMRYERFIMVILLALVYTGILTVPLNIASDFLFDCLDAITRFIC